MNNPQSKNRSVMAHALAVIIFAVFCNTATAIDLSAKTVAPAQPTIECLFNWAQTFYPNLFSPAVTGLQLSSPYTYRFYPGNNTFLGISSADNHVYYQRPNDITPQDQGDVSVWLTETGCGTLPYPVIFIHGITSSADTWIPYRDYLINNAGWKFGGIPAYNPATKSVAISCPSNPNQPVACTGTGGDFYTLNFSDNQNLSFDVQGSELAAIIQAVLNANPGKTKVLLISHSMGGLAAREYLQGLARESNATATIPYRGDVAKLIGVGVPHQGSFWAEDCYSHFDILDISGNVGICSLLSVHINPNSIVLKDLQPNSAALNVLNDLSAHPLPTIPFVSIIGTGQSTLTSLVNLEDGDGVVVNTSQDLAKVTANIPLQQKSIPINIPFRECANEINIPLIGKIGATHLCETSDTEVGAEILRNLQ